MKNQFKQIVTLMMLAAFVLIGCTAGDTVNNQVIEYPVPGVPSNVQATPADGQVTITWSPASNATSYNIYWKLSSGVTTTDSAIVSASSPYVHQGLTNGTACYYVVTAVNIEGESGPSTEVSATPISSSTAPATPANVQATAADGQNAISWSPVSGAIYYNIYWADAAGVTTSSSKISTSQFPYLQTGLTNGTTYYYRVSAVNSVGESSLSPEVSAAPTSSIIIPAAPKNLQLAPGDGKITVTWDPVANASSYNIYWSLNSGVSTSSNRITSADFPYVHTGLNNNNTYYYRVSAVNSAGESTLSSETSAQPRALFSMELNKLISNPTETNAWFGKSVSISGDYAIVGACLKDDGGNADAGAAYIFHRTGPNSWDAGTKLTASDIQASVLFGISVSISGDYAIVGAGWKNEGGNANAGAAYIFHRTGLNTWDAGTKLTASDIQASAYFGSSVAISGDYAIVAAPGNFEGGIAGSGAVYIFRRTGTNTWDSGVKILSSFPALNNEFGFSVAISGDYAVIGTRNNEGGFFCSGAAYIFHKTGLNTWDSGTKITASDLEADAYFGVSTAISGDYAVVGAGWKDEGGNADAGAAYIFHRTGANTWDAGTKITASDLQASAYFGVSVSISGEYLIVGAEGNNQGGATRAGAAYIFHRTNTNTWGSVTKITPSVPGMNAYFGSSVSISGDYALIGAYQDTVNGNYGAGAAYIY